MKPQPRKPPYGAALGIFAVVLAGYVLTLAPTVTFWDAGEFVAAVKTLGVPHPPGTPLFVLLGHVWSTLVPIGGPAYRTNLMTAVFSAASAACFFLLVAQALRGWGMDPDEASTGEPVGGALYTIGGATAAALISAFVFTVWQNSNETEVYMVATFTIAAICWLAWIWRRARGTRRAAWMLLLIIYLGALSVANHLLTLLVGPAVIGFVWHVQRTEPLESESDRRAERGQLALLVGIWALLVGLGLGSTPLLIVGAVLFFAATVYAALQGSMLFAVLAFGLAVVGASAYLVLKIRAGLHPLINEADPSSWQNLWAVIRRQQYPPRSPLDDPTFPSGPANPGRTPQLIGLQIINYFQYFDWQWANGLETTRTVFAPARLPFTLFFSAIGFAGWRELHRRDRSVFWLLLILFLVTGPLLMGYMNFKPGHSLGWSDFPRPDQHEVRERDYFFTVSFQVWGLLAGIGLAAVGRQLAEILGDLKRRAVRGGYAVLAIALVPFGFNFTAASRNHGPATTLARDFAYDLLQSVPPYGILFTNGDNDTFPLWYLQDAEGVRPDVAVVNLTLGNTDWYIRQLRDDPVRRFDPAQAPWYAAQAPAQPPPPLLSWTNAEIAELRPQTESRAFTYRAGHLVHTFAAGSSLLVRDILMLRLIQENAGRRQIYYSITAGNGSWSGFGPYLTSEGLVVRLHVAAPPDSSRLAYSTVLGLPIDLRRTDSLATVIYRYAGLFKADTLELDAIDHATAHNFTIPFLSLGQVYARLGDRQQAADRLRRAYHLEPSAQLREAIEQLAVPPSVADSLLRR